MKVFKIALFGHRDFSAHLSLEHSLAKILSDTVKDEIAVEVLIGRSGEFDVFAASVVKQVKRRLGEDFLQPTLVLPYCVRDIEYYEDYYDDVIIPVCLFQLHPKARIAARNKYMVDNADLCIFFVEREQGGAYEALRYARSVGRDRINLAGI